MKLTGRLAYSQLTTNKRRTVWTLLGIVFSCAMFTAVYGFVAGGYDAFRAAFGPGLVREAYYMSMGLIGGLLSLIIVITSVIVVSNSFRISAGERLTQFGILKSVGATKKQIAQTVIYEGLLLSAIGIPIGIAAGFLVQFAGVGIANYLMSDINAFREPDYFISFNFIIAWQAVLASVFVAFFTVLLSAWLPARKAAKIPAIDAIRGADEIKLKSKRVRTNPLIRKLFGFEGELAAKSLKRSRRNFRATVVSLSISMVLFIAASSFGAQLSQMTNLVFAHIDANVSVSFHSNHNTAGRREGEIIYMTISGEEAEAITSRMRGVEDTVFGVGGNWVLYEVEYDSFELSAAAYRYLERRNDLRRPGDRVSVTLLTVDSETYAELAGRAGVPLGSNILINHARRHTGEQWAEFVPLVFMQNLQIERYDGEVINLPIHGELRGSDVPNELIQASFSYVTVLVPDTEIHFYFWYIQAAGPHTFSDYARNFLPEMLPPNEGIGFNSGVFDQAAEENAVRSLFNTIMIAVYSFVGMLTLIALTNVISTISTNVRSRSREFAVLQSVGMTHGGLKNMLNLESILCSAKSLIYGIPLGVGASYLMYLFLMESVWFPYQLPWLAIIQCVAAVFAITWLTMRFSASRLQNKNIVESIRAER